MQTPRIIELDSPSPYERGRQHGDAAIDLIARSMDYYREVFANQAGLSWHETLDYVGPWQVMIEREYPDLFDEMRGIADGANVALAEIVALNCRGEIIYDNWFSRSENSEDIREEIDGCTSFSLTDGGAGDGHTYAGQNWDWRHAVRDTVVILRIVQPPKPTIIMQVEAGQVGRHGANSAGIALNANGLGGRFENRFGVPQTVIRRTVLDSANISEALKVLVRTRAHVASNALLTHRDGFTIDIETTPGGHGWEYAKDGVVVHGNHYQAFVPPQLAENHRPMSPDSLIRVPQARKGLGQAAGLENSEDIRASIRQAMSDHLGFPDSLCAHPDDHVPAIDQWSTTLSSCVDLTTGEYFIAAGPPCQNLYQAVPFNVYDEATPLMGASLTRE